jgi:3-deoxy-D-manno-octulosonate 8-phosphate phosphatase (KDO 8-P phosphatase)
LDVQPRADSTAKGTAAGVRVVVLDVDGVLTDGAIVLNADGVDTKRFHVLDGTGIHFLRFHGFEVGLLSGRKSPVIEKRARELGVSFFYDGVLDKRPKLLDVLKEKGYRPEELCYVGDDIIDLPCLRLSGFPVAVANARPEVKKVAAYITRCPASQAAVREVAEVLLRAKGRWRDVLERYHA